MATHSSILAQEIPWTEETGGLQSVGHKGLDTTSARRRHARCRAILCYQRMSLAPGHSPRAPPNPSRRSSLLCPECLFMMPCVFFIFLPLLWSEVKWSEVAQSCPTLCDPMDCSLPGSSVPGILQARVLEWVAISFSRRSSQPRDGTRVSHIAGRRFTIWATRES